MKFFAELKRRQIYRVAAAYAVVAWLLLQLVNNVAPVLDLPVWVARSFVLLLVIGFPVALFFAWMRELPPAEAAPARASNDRLNWALIGALVVVIALTSYQQLARGDAEPDQIVQASVAEARQASLSSSTAISVAVLPLANLSGDTDQEYFSDGMTDEISRALVKIPDLRVVARTSAFQFKGKNADARAIGETLGATHLIEGSVRKAGNQLRISVDLVKAADGVTVWSNKYDRELKDVFAIQEDIARAIATAFGMQVGLRSGTQRSADRLDDPAIHELYLRARGQLRVRDTVSRFGLTYLEEVVARAPNFAPGWALLSQSLRVKLVGQPQLEGTETYDSVSQRAVDAARKAIELDPELAEGYAALAAIRSTQTEWAEALDLNRKALALDPDNPEVLQGSRTILRRLGYLKEAMRVSEHLTAVEPLVGVYTRITGEIQLANGLSTGARTMARSREQMEVEGELLNIRVNTIFASAQAHEGRLAEAADTLLKGVPEKNGPFDARHVEAAVQVLRAAAQKQQPPPLPAFNSELNFVYIYAGVPERMLEWWEQDADGAISRAWWPLPSSVRQTERFKALLRKSDLVDYWRANGWPDLCHPVGTDDFACV
jgi:adenylate cyclase